ncbi:MAG TPA: lysine--tRNA ligase, partial [Blastocatellia bacterium]|nr:lysine--tRNA ligase [Blastocatellia bacterium]
MTEDQRPADDINDQIRERKRSLEEIVRLGFHPYPHKYDRTHTITEIARDFGPKTAAELESTPTNVRVSGRIHAINKMGKAAFVRFTDGWELLQVYVRSNEAGEAWQLFKLLDLGDVIGVSGRLFRTKTGELSIHAESLMFLAKALVPPPDKYYGLADVEMRYRQRYADLMANREVRAVFQNRSRIIGLIRRFFDGRGYLEVETPMLTPLATGATAKPFVTHHNALGIDLYARIAPELYLKRLIVGGFEKVYEINRNFRNEGLSIRHNPEFTMLEFYEAYSEYEDLIGLTQSLISGLVEQVCGGLKINYGEDEVDFSLPWARMTMREAIVHYWRGGDPKPNLHDVSTREGVWALLGRLGPTPASNLDYGHLLGDLFEAAAEPHLVNPVFITEFPVELSPLSKRSEDDPAYVDRFELFIARMEIANGFCEINDPADQRARFESQMRLRERGDEEAMVIDEDYIRALSYGMP